jgi:hypothetical protein
MSLHAIGSLYKHVADMDGEHGRPVTLRRVKLSDALKAERNQLFGKKPKGKGKVAGRFVDYKMNKTIPIKAVFHDEEKSILLSHGMDFNNGIPKMDNKDFAMKLKRYMENRCDMSIYEMAMKPYSLEKYFFTAGCVIMRYTYDISTRDTAYLFDIERDIVTNAVKSCREKKFQVGKVLECMKELYGVMR